jgi:hypothetical protein
MLALNEITPYFSDHTSRYAAHILAALYLAVCCYGIKYTDYAFIVLGNLSQVLSHAITSDNANSYINSNKHLKSTLRWLIGLGLQIGLDFMTKTGGLLIASYVGGTVLQSLSTYFSEIVMKNFYSQHPYSKLFLKNLIGDMAFCSGSLMGQYLHYGYKTITVKKEDDSNFSSNTFKSKTNEKTQNQHKERALIKLTEDESELLFNNKKCRMQYPKCLKTARKVLQLDLDKLYKHSEIRSAYREASLFWHPDKMQGKDKTAATEQMTFITAANEILKSTARPSMH